jgi:hypothetical protein
MIGVCPAQATIQNPKSKIQNLPEAAAAVEAFVPQGWAIERRLTGDLDRDSQPDEVLALIEDLPIENEEGVYNERSRAMIVLLREADGQLRRAALGDRVLACTTCAGMLGDPLGGNVGVEIEKGVIVVRQLSGAREATDLTQRFRYDPATGRFALIGQDVDTYDRATGDGRKESSNFLTGLRIVETYQFDQKLDRNVTRSSRRERISKEKTFLEDVDYERP